MSIFEDIEKEGLTPENEKRLSLEFGARGKKAIETVRSGKIKKYKDFFVVQGSTGDYIVEEDFCTCNDYLYRLSVKGGVCYHSIAVRIANATGEYGTVNEWYTDIISKDRKSVH